MQRLRIQLTAASLAISGIAACVTPAAGQSPRYVNSRIVLLSMQVDAESTLDCAELYVSVDDGAIWTPAISDRASRATLRFVTPADGQFDFYFVLENGTGRSASPETYSPPHARVIVDTLAPILQLHSAGAYAAGDDDATIDLASGRLMRLSLTLLDEHLGEKPLLVFYRDARDRVGGEHGPWLAGGPARRVGERWEWPIPPAVDAAIDLRVVAIDLAGNQGEDELRDVEIRSRPANQMPSAAAPPALRSPGSTLAPDTASGGQPSASNPTRLDGQVRSGAATADSGPVIRVAVTPAAPAMPVRLVATGGESDNDALPPSPVAAVAASTSPDNAQRVAQLRALAHRHLNAGEFDLSAARLSDALDLSPGEPDLLADLGAALAQARRFDQADQRFAQALAADPRHRAALDGRALLAATQQRYADARALLSRRLELDPDSPQLLLRLGDLDHRLGNAAAARQSWRRAAELGKDDGSRKKALRRLELLGMDTEVAPRRNAENSPRSEK
ncbi:MAG: hypothetical protein U1D55_10715 [Phycisphaerae bacterium]